MRKKDKKSLQIENKRRHKEGLRSVKARRKGEPLLERNAPERLEKPAILIVCEGVNTEPGYFRQFRLSSATIKTVGEGYNTTSLVNRTKELALNGNYEQIWCVFDKDDFPDQDFNEAIAMAEREGFGVAYSNQAFEYWFILHFEDHQGGAMHRDDYEEKLNSYLRNLGCSYDGKGSKAVSSDMFECLMAEDPKTKKPRYKLAIERAQRIFDNYDHASPAQEESSTTVFHLVMEIDANL